jgi:hypothetical protein
VRGFRFWLETPDERLVYCMCDWAPEAGTHYRYAAPDNGTDTSQVG